MTNIPKEQSQKASSMFDLGSYRIAIDNEFACVSWSARRASNPDRTFIRSLLCQLSYEPDHYMIPKAVNCAHVD